MCIYVNKFRKDLKKETSKTSRKRQEVIETSKYTYMSEIVHYSKESSFDGNQSCRRLCSVGKKHRAPSAGLVGLVQDILDCSILCSQVDFFILMFSVSKIFS